MSAGYWSWCPTCGKDEKCIKGICQKCGRGPDGELASPPPTEPKTYDVSLILSAKVTVTPEILEGIKDQYPGLYQDCLRRPEAAAEAMLYASCCQITGDNDHHDDWWDGVGKMRGLIKGVTMEAE